MPHKNYDLAILTDGSADAGTNGEVWLKLDGSLSSTGWFPFRDDRDRRERNYFRPGSIEYASFRFRDLGELSVCSVQLRSKDSTSWHPISIEVIDSDASWTWEFGTRVFVGEPQTKSDPVRDAAKAYTPVVSSAHDQAVDNAIKLLSEVQIKWQDREINAPTPGEVITQILALLENANMLRKW